MAAVVSSCFTVFVKTPPRNRNVSVETVLSDFGQGSLLIGKYAVEKGLADRLGSLDQLIQEKTSKINHKISYQSTRENSMTDMLSETTTLQITTDDLMAQYPDVINTIKQTAVKEERERIQSVEAQCIAGHEILIQQLKFDGKTTGAEAALQILAAEKVRQSEKPSLLPTLTLPPLPIASSVLEETHGLNQSASKSLSLEEQWKTAWQNDPTLQTEFGSLEVYLAFRKAEQKGQVSLFTQK